MTVYTEVSITPHHAGFGMFQRGELQVSPQDSWSNLSDLLHNIWNAFDSSCPIEDAICNPQFIAAGVEDIRGRINNQPPHIIAALDNEGELRYIGIVETEVADNFFAADRIHKKLSFSISDDLSAALTDECYLLTVRSESLNDYDTYKKCDEGVWEIDYDSLSNRSKAAAAVWENVAFAKWATSILVEAKN